MMCCMGGLLNPQEELGCSRTMKRSGLMESNMCMANALDSQTRTGSRSPTKRTLISQHYKKTFFIFFIKYDVVNACDLLEYVGMLCHRKMFEACTRGRIDPYPVA